MNYFVNRQTKKILQLILFLPIVFAFCGISLVSDSDYDFLRRVQIYALSITILLGTIYQIKGTFDSHLKPRQIFFCV